MASSSSNGNDFASESSREEGPRAPEAELAALVARDLQRYLTRQIGSLGDLAGGWSDRIGKSSKGAAERGAEEAEAAYAQMRRYVRRHPVKSVAGSFAVGALIGILTKQ